MAMNSPWASSAPHAAHIASLWLIHTRGRECSLIAIKLTPEARSPPRRGQQGSTFLSERTHPVQPLAEACAEQWEEWRWSTIQRAQGITGLRQCQAQRARPRPLRLWVRHGFWTAAQALKVRG